MLIFTPLMEVQKIGKATSCPRKEAFHLRFGMGRNQTAFQMETIQGFDVGGERSPFPDPSHAERLAVLDALAEAVGTTVADLVNGTDSFHPFFCFFPSIGQIHNTSRGDSPMTFDIFFLLV